MKIRWTGETEFLMLTKNKIYHVISVEQGWYRIIDDSGEDYLYPPEKFEVIQKANEPLSQESGPQQEKIK
ncbi:hypothetical protein [Massiliimalia massiliensis]|uniref:hypothetical protein n=1 Tax=Massiliimalia massiliensis TaxID=1852384 RepID=UPI0009845CF4|nr:hypothetical protein [Massiliimalia massiliensis]